MATLPDEHLNDHFQNHLSTNSLALSPMVR
jgi:hypothetical protein